MFDFVLTLFGPFRCSPLNQGWRLTRALHQRKISSPQNSTAWSSSRHWSPPTDKKKKKSPLNTLPLSETHPSRFGWTFRKILCLRLPLWSRCNPREKGLNFFQKNTSATCVWFLRAIRVNWWCYKADNILVVHSFADVVIDNVESILWDLFSNRGELETRFFFLNEKFNGWGKIEVKIYLSGEGIKRN